jgi:hypothetical protein
MILEDELAEKEHQVKKGQLFKKEQLVRMERMMQEDELVKKEQIDENEKTAKEEKETQMAKEQKMEIANAKIKQEKAFSYDNYSDSEDESMPAIQPAVVDSSSLTPINKLDNQSTSWSFIGRCIFKSNLRTFVNNENKSVSVYNLDFMDKSGVIERRVGCFESI